MITFPKPGRIASIFALVFLVLGGCAVLAAVAAPYIGLGIKEEFIFYRLAEWSRSDLFRMGIFSGLAGLALALPSLMRLIDSWPWGADKSRRLRNYFALPPAPAPDPFNRRDQKTLLAAAIFFQALYLLFIPLGYECDAAMYFAYAKGLLNIDGGYFPHYRPPGFPIFLITTGQFLFDSFIITVMVQAVMGVLASLLVYRSLAPMHRVTALACSGAFIISGIPFAAAKLMLATQLYMFLVVATIYAFSRYYFTNNPRFIYLTVFTGLAAMFTRWEAVFLLAFAIVAMFVIGRKTSRHLRHVLAGFVVVMLTVSSWSFLRSVALGEPALFGSLHNGSSRQLFWRLYLHIPSPVMRLEILTGQRKPGELDGLIMDKDITPHASGPFGTRLIAPGNGPATSRFFSLIAKAAAEAPETYRILKTPLDKAHRYPGQEYLDYYHKAFGQFEEDSAALANNIIMKPNMFYPNYIFSLLNEKLGIYETDKLLNGVIREAVMKHPVILLVMASQGMTMFGVDVESRGMPVFTYWRTYHYHNVPYNKGGCSENSLPPAMIEENLSDERLSQSLPHNAFMYISSFLRNMVRNVAGILALLSWWIIPFARDRIFLGFLACSSLAVVGVIGVMGGGIYTRYEYSSLPLILITTSGTLFTVFQFLQRKFSSSAGSKS